MKRKESKYAIKCYSYCGPIFGNENGDILITDNCNENSCSICNDGTTVYECHTVYKSSLFVKTERPNERNRFTVLDYEVYTHY